MGKAHDPEDSNKSDTDSDEKIEAINIDILINHDGNEDPGAELDTLLIDKDKLNRTSH